MPHETDLASARACQREWPAARPVSKYVYVVHLPTRSPGNLPVSLHRALSGMGGSIARCCSVPHVAYAASLLACLLAHYLTYLLIDLRTYGFHVARPTDGQASKMARLLDTSASALMHSDCVLGRISKVSHFLPKVSGEKRTRRAKEDVVADVIHAWPEGHEVISIDPEFEAELEADPVS